MGLISAFNYFSSMFNKGSAVLSVKAGLAMIVFKSTARVLTLQTFTPLGVSLFKASGVAKAICPFTNVA